MRLRGTDLPVVPLLVLVLLLLSPPGRAESVEEINARADDALAFLRDHVEGVDVLLRKAAGVLVFPHIVKLGFGAGGQYGEGVLLVDQRPTGYYATSGAPFGLPLGVQFKAEVILFVSREALQDFRDSLSWEVGVDADVALPHHAAGKAVSAGDGDHAVVGFIFSSEGLSSNLTFEGAKISRLAR